MSAAPLVVSVHALDAGGGDGFVADAAVFAELECRAACIATSVLLPEPLALDLLSRQLEAAGRLAPAAGARVGFVVGPSHVELVAAFVRRIAPSATVFAPPVHVAGSVLLESPTLEATRRHLFPAARVLVTRAADVAALSGREVKDLEGLRDAAQSLRDKGAKAVVIAGLLVRGRVLDLLNDDGSVVLLDTARIQAPRVPGLAGAHAAALAAHLARGLPLADAVEAAQRYIGFRLVRGR
jgi:hydroxymethylpyrimidine/phosphomethylpyrimidine kinase